MPISTAASSSTDCTDTGLEVHNMGTDVDVDGAGEVVGVVGVEVNPAVELAVVHLVEEVEGAVDTYSFHACGTVNLHYKAVV
jgi:hypothetical protein